MTRKMIILLLALILAACTAVSVLDSSIERERRLNALYVSGSILARSALQDIAARQSRVETVVDELVFDRDVASLTEQTSVGNYIISLLFDIQDTMDRREASLYDLSADLLILMPNDDMPESYGTAVRASRYDGDADFRTFLASGARAGWQLAGSAPSFTSLEGQSVVAYDRKITTGRGTVRGVIRCLVPVSRLFGSGSAGGSGVLLTVCRGSRVVYTTSGGVDPEALTDRQVLDGYMTVRNELTSMDMSLILQLPVAEALRESRRDALLVTLVVFLTGLALLTAATAVVSHMTKRLERMTDAVQQSSDSVSLRRLLPGSGDDEAGQLSAAFQDLLRRNEEAHEAILAAEKGKRAAQSMALQYQMDPHFLFNSLYWLQLQMESRSVEPELSDAVACLGGVLHYNLEGDAEATIAEEKRHIEAYVAFMKSMTGDEVVLQIGSTPELDACRVLRFTLQPLLENAIRHGHIAGSVLHIGVLFRERAEEGLLEISVRNDGRRMTGEQADALRERLAHPPEDPRRGHGIALINLKRRIELMYGGRGTLEIEAGPERDTRVLLTLPLEACRPRGTERA